MGHALAEQCFGLYEDVKKWFDEWFAAKREDFVPLLARKMGKCITAMEHTLNKAHLIVLPNLTCFLRKNPHFIIVRLVMDDVHPCIFVIHHDLLQNTKLSNFGQVTKADKI